MLVLSKRVLMVLVVLNWVFVAFFAAVLVFLLSPVSATIAADLAQAYGVDRAAIVVRAMAWVMVLAIMTGVVVNVLFRRMLAIVRSAIDGDAFTLVNARRLRTVGWALLMVQILDLGFGMISLAIDSRAGEPFGWTPSVGGWIAALMVFVLARVFEQGSRMRDELAMTV